MSDEALPEKCHECGSRGIEFSGHGLDMQYKICSRYKSTDTPENHPTLDEVRQIFRANVARLRPSGRFA